MVSLFIIVKTIVVIYNPDGYHAIFNSKLVLCLVFCVQDNFGVKFLVRFFVKVLYVDIWKLFWTNFLLLSTNNWTRSLKFNTFDKPFKSQKISLRRPLYIKEMFIITIFILYLRKLYKQCFFKIIWVFKLKFCILSFDIWKGGYIII